MSLHLIWWNLLYKKTEIELPDKMSDDEEISDYLSDVTGYCHCGYNLVG